MHCADQDRHAASASAASNGASASSRIAVLGASGYTGAEVVRLLAVHPTFSVVALTGESNAGKARPTPAFICATASAVL